jgi:hypothetical protein
MKDCPHVSCADNAEDPSQLHGERRFLYNDGEHILEIQVAPEYGRPSSAYTSIRFALCHPDTVDDIFISFVLRTAKALGLTIEIKEDLPANYQVFEFSPPSYNSFQIVAEAGITNKRKYWVADFGPQTATLGCAEAMRRYSDKLMRRGE